MAELGARAALRQEALACRLIAANLGAHDLDRHLVAEQPAPGAEHRPHASFRQRLDDHVPTIKDGPDSQHPMTMIRHG
jgi:hypothetical protein